MMKSWHCRTSNLKSLNIHQKTILYVAADAKKNPQPSTIQWFSHDFDDEKPVLLLLLFCLRTHKSLLKSGVSQWFKNLKKRVQ